MPEKKTCPACAENVRADSAVCPWCEHRFATPEILNVEPPAEPVTPCCDLTRLGFALIGLGLLAAGAAIAFL